MEHVSWEELAKLVRFSQESGDTLVIGLQDGPVAVVPFEKYQSLVLKKKTKVESPSNIEESLPNPFAGAPMLKSKETSSKGQFPNKPKPFSRPIPKPRVEDDEYLVEPLE